MSQQWKLPDRDRQIIDAFKKSGPRSAASRHAIEDVVHALPANAWTAPEIANALLFMLFAQPNQHYNVNEFVSIIRARDRSRQVDWNAVVDFIHAQDLRISVEQFTRLFRALLHISSEQHNFDVQRLWAGQWHSPRTQISFLRAFFEMPNTLPSQISNFESAFSAADFARAPAHVREKVEAELEKHQSNFFAMKAVFEVILASDTLADEDEANAVLHEVVRNHLFSFLLSLVRITTTTSSFSPIQEKFVDSCFRTYLEDQRPDSDIALEALFHQDRNMVYHLCINTFHTDPRRTEAITRKAQELGWIEFLLEHFQNPLALDIACLMQRDHSEFDLEQWITRAVDGLPRPEQMAVGNTLWKFLRIKADDEYRLQKQQVPYQSIPLSLPAAFVLLWKVQELLEDRDQVKAAQCTCLTTYPRLMNYGTDLDHILEKASELGGHRLGPNTDAKMSELFGQMYRAEVSIPEMIRKMKDFKLSEKSEDQDLFCCIVHGLFDEYGCYGEYPEEALEKTALLFGSIIRFRLLPAIPQEYGLTLIVDAIRDQQPDTPMHRFGIEALLQVGEVLMEWPSICAALLQIPSLQHAEIVQRAQDGIRNAQLPGAVAERNGHDEHSLVNGTAEETRPEAGMRGFRSLRADPVDHDANFTDPDAKSQERILFVMNNLSKENMDSKLASMREVLKPEHFQWFASYLVEQRVRLELNNQELYKNFLLSLEEPVLSAEVLRETYVSVAKSISARSTMDSQVERTHLKNLGAWLGSLTLAQDKPIRHRNIYFIDLLLEAFETQRLIIVIPFTCKVLVQGKDSIVFKSPNPWLVEILGVLVELYHYADLKLNLKFEIEVLCKDLSLDHKKIEPATMLRDFQEQQHIEALTNASAMDNIDEYDLTLRGGRLRESFTVAEIMQSLPGLDSVLRYPPPSGGPAEQAAVKQIINKAVQRAIEEIIAPVVERSITIASLSTSQLVSKDYSVEASPDRFTNAAREMVKSLAGSLALVTCKEPLRMSIQNYIRQNMEEIGSAFMAEGQILMTVNDNLDVAAQLIKEAAEQRAVPEMDQVIDAELADRRRFIAENPGGEYFGQSLNRWSTWIPEPYKTIPGGLNEAQRAVYEEFERRVHGMNVGHIQNASTDSTGRQLPDVLNESLAMPNLSTPAGQPALPHQSPLGPLDSASNSGLPQPRMNGISDSLPPLERILLLMEDIQKAARSSTEIRLQNLDRDSVIFQQLRQIVLLLGASGHPAIDHLARQLAEKITSALLRQPPQNLLEADFLAFMLNKLCNVSELIVREVMRWITANEEPLLANCFIAVAFMYVGLMEHNRVDGVISSALREHSEVGLRLLHDLMEHTLFNDEPTALRADFVNSIVALYAWLKDEPDHPIASEISSKLKAHGIPEFAVVALNDKVKAKQDQMGYVFKEWVSLNENQSYNESTYAGFLRDLHNSQLINSADDLVTFLRLAVELSVDSFEVEAQSFRGSISAAFSRVDSLALLVLLLIKFQGEQNGAVKLSKPAYLDSLLSMVVLIINSHQELRGVGFNQRVFARFFTSLLYSYVEFKFELSPDHIDFMLVIAKTFKSLQPALIPAFAFGWVALISHRVFVEGMLRSRDEQCVLEYRDLIGMMLQYSMAAVDIPQLQAEAELLIKGTWKNFVVLQNDFPDFICTHHAYFCSRISARDPYIRNLVLSAQPSGLVEPNPLTPNLRVERLEDMKKPPVITNDIAQPLEDAGLSESLQAALRKTADLDSFVNQISEIVVDDEKNEFSFRAPARDSVLLESLTVVLAQDVQKNGSKFDANSNHVQLVTKMLSSFQPRQKYLLLLSMFDQLRYPNSHTEYYCKLILHLWGTNSNVSEEQMYLREVMIRLLRERITDLQPNPWGVIVVFKELSDNSNYGFWDTQPFVNEPELRQRLVMAARATGQH